MILFLVVGGLFAIALLCGGEPDVDELNPLPHKYGKAKWWYE